MRNKKGFTLIELLAVIVILAIVALIAMPLILNVIDEANKGAFKDSAYGIIEAGELSFAQDILDGDAEEVTFTYTNGQVTSSVEGKQLNYKGVKPENGIVTINDAGQVELKIHNGKYCVKKLFSEREVSVTEKTVEECTTGVDSGDGGSGGTGDTTPPPPTDPIIGLYLTSEITTMIDTNGYIPIASADELNNARNASANTFGAGTDWEGTYTGGLDKKYIQLSDIDLSSYSSGEGWVPLGDDSTAFTGIFDGNGYKISNMSINRPAVYYQGLFGILSGSDALIDNVVLENVNITGYQFTGSLVSRMLNGSDVSNSKVLGGTVIGHWASTGGLIGQSYGSTNIVDNCHSAANVIAEETDENITNTGGLIGWNTGSVINSSATGNVISDGSGIGGLIGYSTGLVRDCYATGSVRGDTDSIGGLIGQNDGGTIKTSMATGDVIAVTQYGLWVGGLVGLNDDDSTLGIGKIENCYATGAVTAIVSGSEYVGALVGANVYGSTITNSYAIGAVNGDQWVGGLIGAGEFKDTMTGQTGPITNSYWNTQTTGQSASEGGAGRTIVQMTYPHDVNTYESWDFDTIWGIDSAINNGYPYLRSLQ